MAYDLIKGAEIDVFRHMVRRLISAYGCNASARKVGVPQDYMSRWNRTNQIPTKKSFTLVQKAYEELKLEKETKSKD